MAGGVTSDVFYRRVRQENRSYNEYIKSTYAYATMMGIDTSIGAGDTRGRRRFRHDKGTPINMLLLCGGLCPEIDVLKSAGHSIGTVYLWDIDLVAVGVAVKNHPEVEFKVLIPQLTVDLKGRPGAGSGGGKGKKGKKGKRKAGGEGTDVNDLWGVTKEHIEALGRDAGHIDLIGITTPCNDISLANQGGRNGIEGKTGSLMVKASLVLYWCQRVFPNAFFYREQVRGNLESQKQIDGISGEGVTFTMNAK